MLLQMGFCDQVITKGTRYRANKKRLRTVKKHPIARLAQRHSDNKSCSPCGGAFG
jgi:hypothetical protein